MTPRYAQDYLHPADRLVRERHAHVLRMVGDSGWLAAARLAAEERRQVALAETAHRRRLAEAGLRTSGRGLVVAALRGAAGAALIRAGVRLRGGSGATPAPAPASVA